MTEMVDRVHFEDLAGLDPEVVCRRAACDYDETADAYRLWLWDRECRVFPRECRVESGDEPLHDYFSLFAVHYLLTAKEVPVTGEWVSEKDIPGGAAFFRGPHEIPTGQITRRFGNDLDAFRKRCAELGGEAFDMADAAFSFDIVHRIPLAVLYWYGDEEFPAEAKVLYDRTIGDQLAMDIVFSLAVGVCLRLGK
jgi:hypothetical protein